MKPPNSIVQKSILKFVLPLILFLLPVSFAFYESGIENTKNYTVTDTSDFPPGAQGDVSGMFNERGYLKSNSVSFDENEIINDFNGNLCYSIPLFNMKGPGDLYLKLDLNYNGSVNYQAIVEYSSAGTGMTLRRNNINGPGWIFSLNGMAIQMLNFETNFFTYPENQNQSTDSVRSDNIRLLATGYHITDRLGEYVTQGQERIYVMRGDGSVLTLKRIATNCGGANNEECYIGEFYSDNKNDYTRAKVKYTDDGSYPTYRNRIVSVMNGDGLTYIYEEYKNKYADFPYNWGSLMFRPQVLMLKKIKDRYGHEITLRYKYNINYLSANYPIYGRPLIETIDGGWPSNGISFAYTPTGAIAVNNYKARYRILTDEFSIVHTGNHRPMVNKIYNPYENDFSFDYNTYRRTPYNIPMNTGASPIKLNLRLKRISSFENIFGGNRIYTYSDDNVGLSIDMNPDEGAKIHSEQQYYLGQGRDMFFTNMLKTKKSEGNESDFSLESFTYEYEKSRGWDTIWQNPVDSSDNYYTTRTKDTVNSQYIYGTPRSVSTKMKYKNYIVTPSVPVSPENPDFPGYTKLVQDKYYTTNQNSPLRQTDYRFVIGAEGSYLDTGITETIMGVSKKIRLAYEHAGGPTGVMYSNRPIIKKYEYDPYGRKTENYYSIYYDTTLVQFKNGNFLYNNQANQDYDTTSFYLINSVDSIRIFSASNIIYKEITEHHLSTDVHSMTEGYIGQIKSKKIFKGGSSDSKLTEYKYSIKDTVGAYLFPVLNSMVSSEGNLNEIIDQMGNSTKYYYHLVDTVYSPITDEYNQPAFKYFKMFEYGTTEDLSSTWNDNRFPTVIQNYVNSGYHINSYKKYDATGNIIEDINHNRYLTDYSYDALERIQTVVMPYDFSDDENAYINILDIDTSYYLLDTLLKFSGGGYHSVSPSNFFTYRTHFNNDSCTEQLLLGVDMDESEGEHINVRVKLLLSFNNITPSGSQFNSIDNAFLDIYPFKYVHKIGGDTSSNQIINRINTLKQYSQNTLNVSNVSKAFGYIVMLQVEMEFPNNYICKLKERKFQNEREKTLYLRTENYYSQRIT